MHLAFAEDVLDDGGCSGDFRVGGGFGDQESVSKRGSERDARI